MILYFLKFLLEILWLIHLTTLTQTLNIEIINSGILL